MYEKLERVMYDEAQKVYGVKREDERRIEWRRQERQIDKEQREREENLFM